MVLSLLIWSAKANYDTQRTELTEMSAKVAVLDRVLAHYGLEAKEARDAVRSAAALVLDRMSSQDRNALEPLGASSEVLYDKIQELSPRNESQRLLQGQALSMALALGQTRWLMCEQSAASMPTPRQLTRSIEAPKIGLGGRFQSEDLVLKVGLPLEPCCLLRHPCGIGLQEGQSVEVRHVVRSLDEVRRIFAPRGAIRPTRRAVWRWRCPMHPELSLCRRPIPIQGQARGRRDARKPVIPLPGSKWRRD